MLKFEIQDQYKGAGISYGLDRGLLVSFDGCLLLEEGMTKVIEFICSNVYMKLESSQNYLLRLAVWIRKIFRIEVLFVEVPPVAEINVQYDVSENEVTVDISCKTDMNGGTLYVMNELGANFFDKGLNNGTLASPPSGWRRYDGLSELFSSAYKLAFNLVEKHVPDQVHSMRQDSFIAANSAKSGLERGFRIPWQNYGLNNELSKFCDSSLL